jgi:hypothetical protein
MIFESMLLRQCATGGGVSLGDGGGTCTLNDLEYASAVMITIFVFLIYLILILAAVYTAYMCNKNNPMWMLVNLFVAVFFPSLYLLIHPNLMLAHTGPKPYCNTD